MSIRSDPQGPGCLNDRNFLSHVLVARNVKMRCGQGLLLLRAMREWSIPGLSLCLVGGRCPPVFFCFVFFHLFNLFLTARGLCYCTQAFSCGGVWASHWSGFLIVAHQL